MRRAVVAAVLSCLAATSVNAQTALPVDAEPPPRELQFLSRFDFAVGMEHLFTNDPRFVWDASFAGELDLVDYVFGRATFAAEYEAVLGREYRAFDPNQGNYMLEGAASARLGPAELSWVFHHVSRHLSDRPKRNAVDWNMIGGRVRVGTTSGRTEVGGRVDLRRTILKSFVDYTWELDAAARVSVAVRPNVAFVGSGQFQVLSVDGSRARGTQHGLRAEAGVRLDGAVAALELFVAAERRIDPYQLQFSTLSWPTVGFRLSHR